MCILWHVKRDGRSVQLLGWALPVTPVVLAVLAAFGIPDFSRAAWWFGNPCPAQHLRWKSFQGAPKGEGSPANNYFQVFLHFEWRQYINVAETELIWAHTVVCVGFLASKRDCRGPGPFMPHHLDCDCGSVLLLFLDVVVLGLGSINSGKVQSLKQALQSACGSPSASTAVEQVAWIWLEIMMHFRVFIF